jgi:hypothetical protein
MFNTLKRIIPAAVKDTIKKQRLLLFQDRGRIFGQPDHIRIYGQDYPYRLASAGFVVERVNLSSEFPNMGLIEDEDIFIARKLV